MKSFIHIFFLSLTLMLATACTHNDGDIGPLFGLWKVTQIDIDGSPNASYTGNIFFSFQSGVYCQKEVLDNDEYKDHFASWKYTTDGAHLLFTFSDEQFQPIPATGMNKGENLVSIQSLSASSAVLSYTDSSESHIFTYHLIKW